MTNPTTRPLFTFVVGRDRSALILWGPCADAVQCPPLGAGASRRVPYPSAAVPASEREAPVYWWHARPAPGGGAPAPDSVRSQAIPLPP